MLPPLLWTARQIESIRCWPTWAMCVQRGSQTQRSLHSGTRSLIFFTSLFARKSKPQQWNRSVNGGVDINLPSRTKCVPISVWNWAVTTCERFCTWKVRRLLILSKLVLHFRTDFPCYTKHFTMRFFLKKGALCGLKLKGQQVRLWVELLLPNVALNGGRWRLSWCCGDAVARVSHLASINDGSDVGERASIKNVW